MIRLRTQWRIFALALAAALSASSFGHGLAQQVKVVTVTDGDTFKIAVRLIGVDAPETRHPRKPIEFFGKEAGEFLRRIVEGKTVRLEFDRRPVDKYGRLLAYVFLPDGVFLNALLVSEGYARASPYPPNLKYRELFQALEREARARQKGMWSRLPPATAPPQDARPPAVGNRKTRIYHTPGSLHYERMLRSKDRLDFASEKEAIRQDFQKSER
ncbi:MAG: thermonuclease family protein [Candidatus Tectomicrobia bacterium]|nr:thermonuclease family protein [Candidatus Tectomicrobia bacterium]